MKKILLLVLLVAAASFSTTAAQNSRFGINVVLNTDITDGILADLGKLGKVRDVLYQVDALTMQVDQAGYSAIRALSYVAAANPD